MTDHSKSDISKLVRVRSLIWTATTLGRLYAASIVGLYQVREADTDEIWLELDGTGIGGRHHSLDAAKAAAQADFERRIIACLTARKENE